MPGKCGRCQTMSLRLLQMRDGAERIVVAATTATTGRRVKGVPSVYALASEAIAGNMSIAAALDRHGYGQDIDLLEALRNKQILTPVDHTDSARVLLTGTGLTHLGSADARDRMHTKAHASDASDSMKMFRMGLEGGKPADGQAGVQPEWFYKGDGRSIVGPESPLLSPDFAKDAGEEPELAGIYVISADGTPFRL